ncbi:hypothetical protein ACFL96_15575 [Thermoproteota archaeon]
MCLDDFLKKNPGAQIASGHIVSINPDRTRITVIYGNNSVKLPVEKGLLDELGIKESLLPLRSRQPKVLLYFSAYNNVPSQVFEEKSNQPLYLEGRTIRPSDSQSKRRALTRRIADSVMNHPDSVCAEFGHYSEYNLRKEYVEGDKRTGMGIVFKDHGKKGTRDPSPESQLEIFILRTKGDGTPDTHATTTNIHLVDKGLTGLMFPDTRLAEDPPGNGERNGKRVSSAGYIHDPTFVLEKLRYVASAIGAMGSEQLD